MKNVKVNETLDNANAFFNESLTSINLNKYLEEAYQIIGNEDLVQKCRENQKLTQLRNKIHKRYYSINTIKLKKLPKLFNDQVKEILTMYEKIKSNEILEADLLSLKEFSKLLDIIEAKYTKLNNSIKTYIKQITSENDKKQKKFNKLYFDNLKLDETSKQVLIKKYEDLVLFSSSVDSDIFLEINRQKIREEKIKGLLNDISKEEFKYDKQKNLDRLIVLNKKISKLKKQYDYRLQRLSNIISLDSKYKKDFDSLKEFYSKIISYDDEDYENAKQTYEILKNEPKISDYILYLEKEFDLVDKLQLENTEITQNKNDIIELKEALDYIFANYLNELDDFDKKIIEYAYSECNNNYNLERITKLIKLIVNKIWSKSITNVRDFNNENDYCFLCSNDEFIDPKYQAILLTKREIEKVKEYGDYQIGFICSYNDNIIYITDSENIMEVTDKSLCIIKTPKQIEDEFVDFNKCNKIALDGFKTNKIAVYLIDDENKDKLLKAEELANTYNLPLIKIKK